MGRRPLSQYRELLPHHLSAALSDSALEQLIRQLRPLAETMATIYFAGAHAPDRVEQPAEPVAVIEPLQDHAETLAEELGIPISVARHLATINQELNGSGASNG